MTLASIQQFSETPTANTDIAGININVGWPPGNVGAAFRTMMSFLADSLVPETVSLNGVSSLTLSAAQAAAQVLVFSGSPSGNCTVTLPNALYFGSAQNITTGGYSVILTAGAGATATIPPNMALYEYECDGATNVTLPSVGYGSIAVPGSVAVGGALLVEGPAIFTAPIQAPSASVGGNLVVTNNNGTYSISISGTAAVATTANNCAWVHVSSKPYLFNQSTDIGSSPSFTNVIATVNLEAAGVIISGSGAIAGNLTVAGTLIVGNVLIGGFAAVKADNGTYGINISGTAAVALAVGWSNIVGKPYAFNQSGDIGASPSFGGATFTGATSHAGLASFTAATPLTGAGCFFVASGVETSPSAWGSNASINCSNGVVATGFFASSDRRLKHDIRDITPDEGWSWVLAGRPRAYTMGGKPSAGFVAQEEYGSTRIDTVMAVPDDRPEFAEPDGLVPAGMRLVRHYEHDIAYLTAALQGALARITALEARTA